LTPKVFTTTDGTPFPATVLDDRSGVETRRDWYELADPGKRVKKLLPKVFAAIKAKAEFAVERMNANDLESALDALQEALELIPEPKQRWNVTGWVLVAFGECFVRQGDFKLAAPPLQDSMICPGTLGNPWVHLRLGQARYELGEMDRAADELTRAYMGGDRDIFEGHDPKYFALLQQVLKLDADGGSAAG
jgi:tetratricopeptide (TPR) repeat protein